MYDIIIHSKLRCLILETIHGYHFLFRRPSFYHGEMTSVNNWVGYKFDAKATNGVQIIRVCGMERNERASWNLDELIAPESLNIESLDVLPYWLWGKAKDEELHKKGKPGDSEYHVDDTPFTQLMTMGEGGRHDHIVSRCSYFALSNGFELDEFKTLISMIHDKYLVKLGTPMPDSDLFGDLDARWEEYKVLLSSEGWEFMSDKRIWKKVKKSKDAKIDERRAAEYVFNTLDCYVSDRKLDGMYSTTLHRFTEGNYDYKNNIPERRKLLTDISDQNFKDTFEKINNEFNIVFHTLFNGGKAELRLTNPNNLLETGIEIIASPPGKKYKSLSLLSGGERSLIAVCLLFSVMNIKQVPFVIFDEVESALDEVNVDKFGQYLNNYKGKTQLLIITHKKKTMEYVDLLYGITMQESGVSKLVSVKLEDIK